MKKLLLLHFCKDENGLMTLGATWDSLALKQLLGQKASVFQLFIPYLPNGYELLEEISAYHADEVLLCQDTTNRYFIRSFNAFIKNAEPQLRVGVCDMESPAESGVLSDLSLENTGLVPRFYSNDLCPVESYALLGLPLAVYLPAFDYTIEASDEDLAVELRFLRQNLPDLKEALFCCDDPDVKLRESLIALCGELGFTPRLMPRTAASHASRAIWNGASAFFSGIYPEIRDFGAAVKHICLDKNDSTEAVLCGLSRFADGNHTVFYDEKNEADFLSATAPEQSAKTGYLPSNEMKISSRGNGHAMLCLNHSDECRDYVILPYTEYPQTVCEHAYTYLKTAGDFDAFREDFRSYSRTGLLAHTRMWQPDMLDKCRFWIKSSCRLDSLPRMRVRDGKIYPCLTSNFQAGDISEDPFDIAIRLKNQKARTALERKCASCVRSAECSQCAALPDFLSRDEFCSLMLDDMNYPYLRCAVMGINYLFKMKQLPELSDLYSGVVQTVTLQSGAFLPAPDSTHASWKLDSYCFLYRVTGQNTRNILFSLKTFKALKVNDAFFRLCECMCRGYSFPEIVENPCLSGDLDTRQIPELYTQVRDTLASYVMI